MLHSRHLLKASLPLAVLIAFLAIAAAIVRRNPDLWTTFEAGLTYALFELPKENAMAGMLILPFLGAAATAGPWSLYKYVFKPLKDALDAASSSMISISSTESPEVYEAVKKLLLEHIEPDANVSSTNVTVEMRPQQHGDFLERMVARMRKEKKKLPPLDYIPTSTRGNSKIVWEGTTIFFNIWNDGEKKEQGGPWHRELVQPKLLHISVYERCSRSGFDVLQRFIDKARNSVNKEESDPTLTNVYTLTNSPWRGPKWSKTVVKNKRDVASVILDEDLSTRLAEDAKAFLKKAEWYQKRSIPYRRGYLLHGPPGTGKTSFAQVLAGCIDADICLLSLTDDINDSVLSEAMRRAPIGAVILLEDVDSVFIGREAAGAAAAGGGDRGGGSGGGSRAPPSGVSFSGLLNAIDGVASQEGRIFLMTTNHIERLDPALIRPGRVDVKEKLDFASHSQMKRLFLKFYGADADGADEFAKLFPERELSMAKLSGYLLQHYADPLAALSKGNAQQLISTGEDESKVFEKIRIWDHLNRVGLAFLAPWFELNSIHYVGDLDGLKADNAAEWCWEIGHGHPQMFRRLTKLLQDGKAAPGYERANISLIRDAFRQHFALDRIRPQKSHSLAAAASSLFDAAPVLRRQESSELQQRRLKRIPSSETRLGEMGGDQQELVDRLLQLSQELIAKVSHTGKVLLSVWQLKWLLRQFDDPVELIAAAEEMVKPRSADSYTPQPLTTASWLKRAALSQDYRAHFEAEGGLANVREAAQFVLGGGGGGGGGGGNDEKGDSALKDMGIDNSADRHRIIALMKAGWSSTILPQRLLPERSAVALAFRSIFPGTGGGDEEDAASQFASALCEGSPEIGRSIVSGLEIEAYLARDSITTYQEALDSVTTLLDAGDVTPLEEEDNPEPAQPCWTSHMLSVAGFEPNIVEALVQAGLTQRIDVCGDAVDGSGALNGRDVEQLLNKMGGKKGDVRRLTRLVKMLSTRDVCGSSADDVGVCAEFNETCKAPFTAP